LAKCNAGKRAVRAEHRVGQAAAFQDVDTVGEQCLRGLGGGRHAQRFSQHRGEQAGAQAAPAVLALGAQERGPQRGLGFVGIAVPQVGQSKQHACNTGREPQRSGLAVLGRLGDATARAHGVAGMQGEQRLRIEARDGEERRVTCPRGLRPAWQQPRDLVELIRIGRRAGRDAQRDREFGRGR
jgi:hypothetical protein